MLSNILYIRYLFLYNYFGLDCFWTWTLGTILILYLFCPYITPVITVSASFRGFSVDLLCGLIDWSMRDLDALIKVYSSDLICFIYSIYLFIFPVCYVCFCLLILLILLFVFDDVVVSFLFFNSVSIVVVLFFLRILLFCRLSVPYCLSCHCIL